MQLPKECLLQVEPPVEPDALAVNLLKYPMYAKTDVSSLPQVCHPYVATFDVFREEGEFTHHILQRHDLPGPFPDQMQHPVLDGPGNIPQMSNLMSGVPCTLIGEW
ncbi:MAG TPA: hypothetical protein VEP50_14115 [bacterium]|nr:hypothetical protein [bacterium]